MGERARALADVGVSLANDASFWRGRRVLVTGHSGFKGGWLTLWLRHLGAEVVGLSLPPNTPPSRSWPNACAPCARCPNWENGNDPHPMPALR